MTEIHQTAIVSSKAEIGKNVKIGPFCVVDEGVVLRDNVELVAHVCVSGDTEVGESTIIYPFASIGYRPQDLKYHGEQSVVRIGKRNSIREYVTIHPGTEGGIMKTTVGDDCLFMIGAHIAHDCVVGSHVIIANNGTLGGHVTLEDYVIIGGLSAVHQFVRVGEHAMIGGMTGITKDIVPYAVASGNRAELDGVNLIGLKRRGFSKTDISLIREAFTILFINKELAFSDRVKLLEETSGSNACVSRILNFINQDTERQFCVMP